MAQLCDQRELILNTTLLWSCQAAKKRFFKPVILIHVTGTWEWRYSGQASLSPLTAEVSCSKPWWLRMMVLAEFVISAGSAEMKGELKEKSTRGQQGKMLARNIFLSLSSQRLLTTWVHISSSKGSSEKKMKERSMLNLTWGMLRNHQMSKTVKCRMSGPKNTYHWSFPSSCLVIWKYLWFICLNFIFF